MISTEVFMDILALHRQGHSMRWIAKKLGIHRNTVKKYITEKRRPQYRKRKRRESILTPFHQIIRDWLEQDDFRATWIFERLKDLGYTGGYDTVRYFVRDVKREKPHLAISLAIKACYHGFKVYFTTMDTLMGKLKESQSKRKAYLTSSLVVVDEVGYLPVDSKEAYLFFQFVSHRYEKNSTIITSNKSFGDWQELFGDPVIATAILDRLLHHCKVVNIKGHSYRLKEHTDVNLQPKRKEDHSQTLIS